jgi:hypothetical protein
MRTENILWFSIACQVDQDKETRPFSSKQLTPSQTLLSSKLRVIRKRGEIIGICDHINASTTHAHLSNAALNYLFWKTPCSHTHTPFLDRSIVQVAEPQGGLSEHVFSYLLFLGSEGCTWEIDM